MPSFKTIITILLVVVIADALGITSSLRQLVGGVVGGFGSGK